MAIATEESMLAEAKVVFTRKQTIVYKLALRPQEIDQVTSNWDKLNAIKKQFKGYKEKCDLNQYRPALLKG